MRILLAFLIALLPVTVRAAKVTVEIDNSWVHVSRVILSNT